MGANAWLREGPPLVIAHRGANAYAPENTLAGFRLAGDQGADAIEFDVRATADGHLVVIHDPSLARTTDGEGEVRDVARGRLLVDIELKVTAIESQVVEMLARAGMTARALITSFLEDAL